MLQLFSTFRDSHLLYLVQIALVCFIISLLSQIACLAYRWLFDQGILLWQVTEGKGRAKVSKYSKLALDFTYVLFLISFAALMFGFVALLIFIVKA